MSEASAAPHPWHCKAWATHAINLGCLPNPVQLDPALGGVIHTFSKRQRGEQGSKHAGHDCKSGQPTWGPWSRSLRQDTVAGSSLSRDVLCAGSAREAFPGAHSSLLGHGSSLDVVLKSRSMRKCDPKVQVKPLLP